MSTESRIKIFEKELDECKKSLKRINVSLSNFALCFIAAVPTLLRIMEKTNPKDSDVRYLIDLFEKSGFEFDKFRDQYQTILDAQSDSNDDSQRQETDALLYAETKLFADLIRRSFNSADSKTQVELREMLCPQK